MNFIQKNIFIFLTGLSNLAFSAYQPLKPSGLIPTTFERNYFARSKDYFEKNKDLKYGKTDGAKKYYHDNQYFMRDLILSGDVIYGDEISSMLQAQADLLAEKMSFRYEPKVYLIRSSESNAFATQTGAIFITTSLIATFDNIYEVIYILCHELAHVEKNHLYEEFIEKTDVLTYRGRVRLDEMISDYYLHSRTAEFQADSLGYRYYTAMQYPERMAIRSLEQLDSSDILPFYRYAFDSTLSLETFFPGLSITKNDLRPFMTINLSHQRTHPEFVDRFRRLRDLKENSPEMNRPELDESYGNFRRICTNETLYAQYLNKEYYKIICFYHLSDFSHCDREFVDFLYAKSLYALLKLRVFIEKERSKYDPNVITVEFFGPLEKWIEQLEPSAFQGPERPFVAYFKKMKTSALWSLTATALLKIEEPSDYFTQSTIYDECRSLYDIIAHDTDTIQSIELYNQLLAAGNQISGIPETDEVPVLILPYEKKSTTVTADIIKINYEYFDSLILQFVKEKEQQLGLNSDFMSLANISTTEELNAYITLMVVVNERAALNVFETYACSRPESDLFGYKKVKALQLFQEDGALCMIGADFNFENGRIENYSRAEMRTSEDAPIKIRSLISKYYETQQE